MPRVSKKRAMRRKNVLRKKHEMPVEYLWFQSVNGIILRNAKQKIVSGRFVGKKDSVFIAIPASAIIPEKKGEARIARADFGEIINTHYGRKSKKTFQIDNITVSKIVVQNESFLQERLIKFLSAKAKIEKCERIQFIVEEDNEIIQVLHGLGFHPLHMGLKKTGEKEKYIFLKELD